MNEGGVCATTVTGDVCQITVPECGTAPYYLLDIVIRVIDAYEPKNVMLSQEDLWKEINRLRYGET
jgi:hypothetical protein